MPPVERRITRSMSRSIARPAVPIAFKQGAKRTKPEPADVDSSPSSTFPHSPVDCFPIRSVSTHTPANLALMSTYLGHYIPIINGGQVKGGVVAILASLLPPHLSSFPSPSPYSPLVHHPSPLPLPTFNRLSGAVQWSNCICLFVNLHSSHYSNTFDLTPTSALLTWYASPSHGEESALCQRLIHHTRSGITVLLFCRVMGRNYRSYGRLEYVSHDASKRPVCFTWQLLDLDELRAMDQAEP